MSRASPPYAIIVAMLVSGLVTDPAAAAPASSAVAGPGTIAFIREKLSEDQFGNQHGTSSIWLMRGNGTGERLVTRTPFSLRWLDGGRRLGGYGPYGTKNQSAAMYTIHRSGRDKRAVRLCVLQNRRTQVGLPEWSPDGRRFTFEYFSRSSDKLLPYIQAASGCPARPLPELGLEHLIPPPDERTIYSLQDSPPTLGLPIWSPDGRTLAMGGGLPSSITSVYEGGVTSYITNPRREGVWLLDPDNARDSASIRTLATWPAEAAASSAVVGWSPDGGQVAVGGSGVFIVDIQSGSVHKILSFDELGGYGYAWSPDGRYIGWWGQGHLAGSRPILRNLRLDLYVVDVKTGEMKNVTRLSSKIGSTVAWSPNSRRIAFSSIGRAKGIWTVSLGGKFTRLTRNFDSGPAWTAR